MDYRKQGICGESEGKDYKLQFLKDKTDTRMTTNNDQNTQRIGNTRMMSDEEVK